jgi:hypothetical protein
VPVLQERLLRAADVDGNSMIAVLCAARNSIYKTMPDVEVYDIDRDVRSFAGGMPVIAHPPCRAWSAYCRHQAKPLPGEKELAPLCVEWLRQCGGVLEHPAHSRLYDELRLPKPGEAERDGLWSMAVRQSWWGDTRSKCTWLLFSGVAKKNVDVPFELHQPQGDRRRWQVMSKHQRAATPPAFAKWLVDIASASEVLRPTWMEEGK